MSIEAVGDGHDEAKLVLRGRDVSTEARGLEGESNDTSLESKTVGLYTCEPSNKS